MVKDRLPEFLLKSSHFNRSQNNFSTTSIDIQYDDYFALYEILHQYAEVRLLLENIGENLERMVEMTQTPNIRNFNENELDDLRCHNLKLGQQLVQIFNVLKHELPNKYDYSLESRIKRGLFYGLHQAYINLWNKNEDFLQSHEIKLKKHLRLHTKILNYNSTDEELEEIIANKTTSLFVDNILEETERERRILKDLMERYSELKKLEKSIEDVHALFLRIQNLVLEQNDLLQVIELHAQQASVKVDKGAGELDQAKVLKKKALKKKTCLILVGTAVLIIVILLIFV